MLPIEIFQKHVILKKSQGDEWKGSCPYPDHNDSTPSFNVNEKTTQFYCFGCGRSGNLFTFLDDFGSREEIENVVKQESLKATIVNLLEPISPAVIQQLHRNLLNDTRKLEYVIRNRFISYFTIKKFLIGYDPDSDRFAFPIKTKSGKFVNIKLHNSSKQPKSISWRAGNGAPRLYPYSALLKSEIVLTEGEFDCLLLHSQGLNGLTSTAGAKTWKREWNELFRDKIVRLLYDSDEAGVDGARKIYGELVSIARTIEIISYDRYPVIIKKSSTENKIDVTNFVKWGGDLHRLLGVQRRS